jgi:hypothetical protein
MFECVGVGIGKNMSLNDLTFTTEIVRQKASELWSNPDFQAKTGSGISVSSRLPVLIPMGENLFRP